MRPDAKFSVPGERNTRSGCYHVSFRSGSRAGGACARAAHAYMTRSDEYEDEDRDPAVYTESDHMPGWAEGDAREGTGMPPTYTSARTGGFTLALISRCRGTSSRRTRLRSHARSLKNSRLGSDCRIRSRFMPAKTPRGATTTRTRT